MQLGVHLAWLITHSQLLLPSSRLTVIHYNSDNWASNKQTIVWNSASARSLSHPELLGTVYLAMSGARQHLTNLNSA